MGRIVRCRWAALLGAVVIGLAIAASDLPGVLWAQDEPSLTPNVNWVHVPLGVNVRAGPGLRYNPVGVLPVGAWVQPLARNYEGDWILISYLYTQGWVYIDGVSWRLNTAALPVITVLSPTPIPLPLYYNTPGGPTYTPNANWVDVGVEGAFVRSGPGQGYSVIGTVFTGDVVDPVAHDADEDWVLIRFGDGYGWIRYDLVAWVTAVESLPVVDEPQLTPSFTPVPVVPTATRTPRPTITLTPTVTPSLTATMTASATFTLSATPTQTAVPTATITFTATPSPTDTPPPTATPSLTATPTDVPSDTPAPTATPSDTPSVTPSATGTASPTLAPTDTPAPTLTASFTATVPPTETAAAIALVVPTEPPTVTPTTTPTEPPTVTPTATPTETPTETPTQAATGLPPATLTEALSPALTATDIAPVPSVTVPATAQPSLTPSATPTALVVAAAGGETGGAPAGPVMVVTPDDGDSGLPVPYLLLGGAVALLVLVYAGAYVAQAANLARYQEGFLLTVCPICARGSLYLEDRRYRMLGIPRVRRVVRCDECRSVLRQVGRGRWRYAVDELENPAAYDALNNRVVTERDLWVIAPEHGGAPPEYYEGDEP
ncbi:MAG: SH3 domain-containing protein [Anaerolineae bacterium]|nr:SH3 domain-containing protein [Anaerolineae bacterium]